MAGKQDIKAGSAFVELFVKGAKFEVGLKKAAKQLREFGDGLTSIGTKIAAIGTAGLSAFGVAVKSFAESGDELSKMALRTGMSVEALSELRYAASQSGASIQDVEKAAKKMATVLHEAATGSTSAAESLAEIGLSIDDLIGLSPDEQFTRVSNALGRVGDSATKAALAQKLFGRTGTMLLPLLAEGEKGMAALRDEARALGVTMGKDEADAATNLGDSFDRVTAAISGVMNAVGSALAPMLIDLANDIAFAVAEIGKWVRNNKELVISAAKAVAIIAAVGTAVTALGLTISAVGAGLSGFAGFFGGLLTVITALITPLGLIATGIVAVGAAVIAATGVLPKLVAEFTPLVASIKSIATSLISGDFKKAWDVAAASIKYVASVALDWFVSLPELASYAAGAVARAIIDGLSVVWEWVKSMPSLVEAMLMGDLDIGGMMTGAIQSALGKIKSTADAMKAGFKGEAMPDFGNSERTRRLREALEDLAGRAGMADMSNQRKGGAGPINPRKGPTTRTGGRPGAGGLFGGGEGPVTVTFSGAALMAQTFGAGGGGGRGTKPEDVITEAIKRHIEETKKVGKKLDDLIAEARAGGLVFG